MKQVNANDLLQSLKEDSVFLLEQIENISIYTPVELLETNDGEGRWNTLQVLEHLNTYYRYYLPHIEKAIAASSAQPQQYFKPGWLGNYFTNSMKPKDGQVKNKMKAMGKHNPDPKLDAKAVMRDFLHYQRTFVLLLEKGKQADLNSVKVPISIASFIRLKLGDVFSFIVAHNNRHWIQIEKLLERFPSVRTA
ncbi:DinB family protein [Flavihumibacter rivuli]|uniref:DinB family protein n=1 Tax=Flavihumibacter rivuli TaxID=2838156 RepID=UPI001BDDFFE4|nr:DinB family protein [Flavihumibacter rivuli]ULQ58390.1 DinB family protein [Flavihumibacter rivuli]